MHSFIKKVTLLLLLFLTAGMAFDVHAQTNKKKYKKRKKYRHARVYYPPVDTTQFASRLCFDSCNLTWSDSLVTLAKSFTGLRYRYGGSDPRGFDCSGFVMYCCRRMGYTLSHTAGDQMRHGQKILEQDAQKGDLIYFGYYNRKRRSTYISHVGIVVGNDNGKVYFIHSASSLGIRIDALDQTWYRKRFMGLRRLEPVIHNQ